MSEKSARYQTSKTLITSKREFQQLDCSKPFGHVNYRAPTRQEVAALFAYTGWSNQELAQLLGLLWIPNKGNSSIRKWKSDTTTGADIPYTAWRLMLIYAGIVDSEAQLFDED